MIVFIGGGNMAQALIGGLIARGTPAADLFVVEPNTAQRDTLRTAFGVASAEPGTSGIPAPDTVVLAVKPQGLKAVCGEIATWAADARVVSIAAGIRLDDTARWLGGHPRVIRTMPNTPALIRRGVTGLYAPTTLPAPDREAADALMAAVGETVWVADEALIDAVTAVSGSGPAYVFHFIEALVAAGIQAGLEPEQARRLTLSTVAGAAELALHSSDSPTVLREKVTSKGGTTAAALASFAAGDLMGLVSQAVQAARVRAAELGDELGK